MANNDTSPWMHFEQSTEDPRIAILHITLPTAPSNPPPPFSLDAAVEYAIAAMHGGPADDLRRALGKIGEDTGDAYRKVLEAATRCDRVPDDFREALHSDWTVRGFRHRADVRDDDLFIRAFRRVFSPYSGSRLVLYRGERSSELEAGRIGLNWSTDQDVARMFASGLCTTYGCDGVLLTAIAEPSAIITGPNDHSANRLGEMEHIVDPRMLIELVEVARFPPYS